MCINSIISFFLAFCPVKFHLVPSHKGLFTNKRRNKITNTGSLFFILCKKCNKCADRIDDDYFST